MSRSNYRNYYKDKDIEKDEIIEDVKDEPVKDEIIEDIKDEPYLENDKDEDVKDETVTKGIVVNCSKLNVRRTANRLSKVLTVIENGTEVIIDKINAANGFYKVIVNDIEGYCVKDYIEIK